MLVVVTAFFVLVIVAAITVVLIILGAGRISRFDVGCFGGSGGSFGLLAACLSLFQRVHNLAC